MADLVERVLLEAEDRTFRPVASANKNIASVEKSAASASNAIARTTEQAGASLITVTDRSQKQINKIVDSVERRLNVLKSPIDRLIGQREAAISKVAGDPRAVERVTAAYRQLIAAQDQIGNESRARRIADVIRNPFNAIGNAVETLVTKIGTVPLVMGGVALALGGASVAAARFVLHAGEAAEQTLNLADRLGISSDAAQVLEAQAKIAGIGVDGLSGLVRKLSDTLADGSATGQTAVLRLESLGVSVVESSGKFRNSVDIIRDFSKVLDRIPDHAGQVKLLSDVFGRGAIESLPLIKNFGELEAKARALGNTLSGETLTRLDEAADKLAGLGISFDRLKLQFAEKLVVTVEFIQKVGAGARSIFGTASDPFNANARAGGAAPPAGPTPAQLAAGANASADTFRGNALVDQFRSRRSEDSLQRQLQQLQTLRNEIGARIQRGAGEDVQRRAIAEFDTLTGRIAKLKTEIKGFTEGPQKQQQAHALLLQAQAEEKTGLARLFIERERAIEQYGVTRKAIEDINLAFGYRVDIEIKRISALRADAAAKEAEVENQRLQARSRAEADAFLKGREIYQSNIEARAQLEEQGLANRRDAELRALEAINAQTVNQQINVEQQRAVIVSDFEARAAELREAGVDRALAREVTALNVQLQTKLITQAAYQNQLSAIEAKAETDRAAIRAATDAAQQAAREQAAIRSAQIVDDHNRSVFDSFKRQAEGILDQTLSKSRNIFQAIGDSLKNAFLTAFKDIVASRTAAILTELVTGQKVGLQNQSPGAGPLGRIAGAIGLGAKPTFAKLEAPNHLGDVSLVGGAVPVVMVGQGAGQGPGSARASLGASSGIAAGIGGLILGGALGRAGSSGGSRVSSAIDFGQGSIPLGGTTYPGGTPPFVPSTSAGMGANGGFFGGIKSQLGQLGDLGRTGAGATRGIGGMGGGAALLGGGILAADGLRRGGLLGLAETTGGGALIGAKFGGPIGALIGAGIGFAAGTVRLFIKGKDEKIREKVKAIYGIDVSKSFARDPLGKLIDSSFGGNIDVGIRSPQVRELLDLYARSTGQQNFPLANRPQAVGLSQSGGDLTQTAALVGGQSVAYSGGTARLAGPVDRLITGTRADANGSAPQLIVQSLSISLNGKSASQALRGEIVNSPDAVAQAAATATRQSTGRREQAVALNTPGLLLA